MMTSLIHPSPRVQKWFEVLGLPKDYADRFKLPPVDEALDLVDAGEDVFGRPQQLAPKALTAWVAMQQHAATQHIQLQMVSAYRSFDYQAGLIRKKLEQGLSLDQILSVSAAPGFSEHHSGCAIDVTSQGCQALTEDFGRSHAYQWLKTHANSFGFVESFGSDNQHGLIWEPWHWCYQPFFIKA